jgi:tRNA pseudouridine55 synthase
MANGIVIIDKPAGWTSMDVCAKLRGILHTRKAGHAGTLDPMATGVLPVFVGQATRAVSFAESGRKEYVAGLHLGQVTDTQDTTGTTLSLSPVSLTRAQLEEVLPRFTGEIAQIPPMYSAVKIGGKKLYELARKGQEVARPPRTVTIEALEVLEQSSPSDFTLRVLCSKGTYIRTLCHDIGQALGCGACMSSLRRTMAAGFTLEESCTIEQVQAQGEALLRPTDSLFRDAPAYCITHPRVESLCRNGNPFYVREPLAPGLYRIYGMDGSFLCLSRLADGTMTSVKNFFGE